MFGLFAFLTLIGAVGVLGTLWLIGWYNEPNRVQQRQDRRHGDRRGHAQAARATA